jgi:hypothetical protein
MKLEAEKAGSQGEPTEELPDKTGNAA